jgi:hypothetical protein
MTVNPQQDAPTIEIYMPSPDDAAKLSSSTATNVQEHEQNEAAQRHEAATLAMAYQAQQAAAGMDIYQDDVPIEQYNHYPTNVPSQPQKPHVVGQLEAAANALLASAQASSAQASSAQTQANMHAYPDVAQSSYNNTRAVTNDDSHARNVARADCDHQLEPYVYDDAKPATSFGSIMSCSMAPLQMVDASFGSLSLEDAKSKTSARIQTDYTNMPTLLSHQRSTNDLLASDSEEEEEENKNMVNWERMRAAFGMTSVPHDIGHHEMDLSRDISGMSALSFGELTLERSPSSTIMRDISHGKSRESTLISEYSESSSRNKEEDLSEQEKLEKMYLDRGSSLVYEDFNKKS